MLSTGWQLLSYHACRMRDMYLERVTLRSLARASIMLQSWLLIWALTTGLLRDFAILGSICISFRLCQRFIRMGVDFDLYVLYIL